MNLSLDPHYYLDEGLSPALAVGLQRFKFRCTRLPDGTADEVSIRRIGDEHGRFGVWVSRDLGSVEQHRRDILDAGISVALIRDENGSGAKHCFLVYTFAYQYRETISRSDVPLYFEVTEQMFDGIPNAVVSRMEL